MDWTTAFGTVLTGLVVVFIALILLILLLTLFRNIFGSVGHKEEEKPAPKPVRAPAPAAPAKPAPVILSDDEGEVAAAITAAPRRHPGGRGRRQDLRRPQHQARPHRPQRLGHRRPYGERQTFLIPSTEKKKERT